MADIDYGTHAAAESIDYGSHEVTKTGNNGTGSIIGDFSAGAFSKLNPITKVVQAAKTLQAVYNDPDGTVANFAKEVLAHPYVAMARGVEAAKAGKPEEAMAHFASAIDPAGFMTEESEVKAATPGQRSRGFGEMVGTGADAYLLPKVPAVLGDAAGGLKNLATRPSVLRTIGTMAGAHAAGPVGAVLGREIAGDIAESLKPSAAAMPPPVPPAEPPPLPGPPAGVPKEVWDKLTPHMQDQLSAKMNGQAATSRSAPAPQPPRDPSYYGVQQEPAAEAPAATQPAPEVGRGPVRPPLAPKPAEAPGRVPENTELTQKIQDLLRKVKIEGGLDPDVPLGEVKGAHYLNKFDQGGNAPVVQSQLRKPYSTADVANPTLIAKDIGEKLAGRITTEQFDSMSKNPKALAVITRQYGVEPDAALIKAIRRRIAARSAEVTGPSTISIADLMKR